MLAGKRAEWIMILMVILVTSSLIVGFILTPPRIETITETTTTTLRITTTTTIFQAINMTNMSDESRLIFLGDDMLVISTSSQFGATAKNFYQYRWFPYSNFTFNNFEFAYWEGECEDESISRIQMLPCGSRLLVKFPSYGWMEIPTQTDSFNSQEYFQWTDIHIGMVNGELESAGLLLVIAKDGSQTVYVTIQR